MTLSTYDLSAETTWLRTALDCAPGALFLLKTQVAAPETPVDFWILLLNKAAEHLAQRPEADLVGRSARRNLAALVPGHLWEKAFEVTATDEAYHELTWLTVPDGSRRRYDLTICPHPNGVALSFQDVTEFEEKKALLEGIVAHSPNGIVVMEAVRSTEEKGQPGAIRDFRTRFYTDRAVEVLGVGDDYFLKSLFERRPEARAQADGLRALLETGGGIDQEFFFPTTERWLDVWTRRLDGNSYFTLYRDITDLKLARQEIDRRKALFEGVMNTSLSAITVYEAVRDEAGMLTDFRVMLTNPTSLLISRREAEDVLGKTMTEIYPLSKTVGLWSHYAAVYETGVPDRVEHHYPDVDRWFDVSMSKLGDGIVVTFNDISESKRAAQKVQDQARLFDNVMKGLQSGLSVLEVLRDSSDSELTDLRYVAVSEAIVNDTGLTRDQLVGSTMLSHFPSVRNTVYWTAFQTALDTGQPQHFDVHYTGEGLDNWVTNAVFRLDENHLISAYTLFNEQMHARQRAERQAAMLQSVLDSTQNPVALFEAIRDEQGQLVDYRYVAQNEANARMVGLTPHHPTERTMLDVLPGLREAGIFDRYVAVTETGQPQRFEQQLANLGTEGWFDLSVVRQGDGIVVSAVDQTELRQALANAERLVDELRRSNTDLEQFAYVASHDLQEPLRKIQSFGERLSAKFGDTLGADGRLYLDRIRDASTRMSLLINTLLSFSRLTRRAETSRSTDLQQVVQTVLSDLEALFVESGARVSVHPLPTVEAAPGQMQQLFQNLLANALKFSRPGVVPEIRISTEPVSAAERTEHRLEANRPYVKITVQDNGIGFEAIYAEQIFVIFKRLHGRAEYEGTGIGLAICKKIVENHGGVIFAEGQPGSGATFTVILPEK